MICSDQYRLILLAVLTPVVASPVARCRAEVNVPRDVGIDQRLGNQVPLGLSFRDEGGKSIQLKDYFESRPVILVLAYYRCPMLCTQVLNGLVKSMREMNWELDKQYRVLTVSFDPREGPDLAARKKATYAASYAKAGTADGWHFLTGAQPEIDQLAKATGYRYAYDSEHDQFAHGSAIMIISPQGRITRYFMGIDFPTRDVRLALVEASQGTVGTPVDRLLLLCYHFDPVTGRYSASALAYVRVASAALLLVVGIILVRAWYRDWKQSRPIAQSR